MTGKPVYVPKGDKERRLQRALLQYFKSENYADVRTALEQTHREELIGSGPGCLIAATPTKTAASANSRKKAGENRSASPAGGYRPHRKSAERGK
jgi:hypothetical protein